MTDFLHGIELIELTSGSRPITAVASAIIGIVGTAPYADAGQFPLDTPVLINSNKVPAGLTATLPDDADPGAEGSLPSAAQAIYDQVSTPIVFVRVDTDVDETTQLGLVVGSSATSQGVYALLSAQSVVSVKPKILIAPGWTHQLPGGEDNPVVAALQGVATSLRSVIVSDGPNDTDEAAVVAAATNGGMRVYNVDPFTSAMYAGNTANRPTSARAAGAIALRDQQNGFWWSPSNMPLNGVLGLARPIGFAVSDPNTSANVLNAAGVATVVPIGGQYRLWGNRTASEDPTWVFLSVRRTADMIYDAIEASFIWALDRPQSANLIQDILNSVNAYLRSLKARGAIIDGKAWADPELNDATTLANGQLYIDFDIEPPAPLERLTFQASRNNGYYTELVSAVSQVTA